MSRARGTRKTMACFSIRNSLKRVRPTTNVDALGSRYSLGKYARRDKYSTATMVTNDTFPPLRMQITLESMDVDAFYERVLTLRV